MRDSQVAGDMRAPALTCEGGAATTGTTHETAEGPVSLRDLLTNRSFLLVWAGRNCCRLGDSIHEVALAWIVFKLTGSALAMGAMLAVTALPQVLLLLVGGLVSDRLSRRHILLVTDGLSFLIIGTFALLWHGHTLTMPMILVGTCLLGALSAFYGPAYAPLLGDIVPARLLTKANAVDGATFSVMTMAGPALGGVLAVWSPTFALAFNALTFLISFMALLALGGRRATGGMKLESISWKVLHEGLVYVVHHSWLLSFAVIFAATNLFCVSTYYVLLPRVLAGRGLGGEAYGLVLSAQGLMSVVCSLMLAHFSSLKRPALIGSMGSLAMCVGGILMGVDSGHLPVALVAGSLLGTSVLLSTIFGILLQTVVEVGIRGRTASIIQLLAFAPMPVGFLVAGGLGDAAGDGTVMAFGAAVAALICLVCTVLGKMDQRIAEDRAAEPSAA